MASYGTCKFDYDFSFFFVVYFCIIYTVAIEILMTSSFFFCTKEYKHNATSAWTSDSMLRPCCLTNLQTYAFTVLLSVSCTHNTLSHPHRRLTQLTQSFYGLPVNGAETGQQQISAHSAEASVCSVLQRTIVSLS